jgi:hypothetical protein
MVKMIRPETACGPRNETSAVVKRIDSRWAAFSSAGSARLWS